MYGVTSCGGRTTRYQQAVLPLPGRDANSTEEQQSGQDQLAASSCSPAPRAQPFLPQSSAGSAASGPGRGCQGTAGNPRPSRRRRGAAGWHSAIQPRHCPHTQHSMSGPHTEPPPSLLLYLPSHSPPEGGSAAQGSAGCSGETAQCKAGSQPSPSCATLGSP